MGRLRGTHQPGLERRQASVRLPRREAQTPGPRQARGGQTQNQAEDRPRPRAGGRADLRLAHRREAVLPGHRRTAQHRPRPLPAPTTRRPRPRGRAMDRLGGPRDPRQPQVHRPHGLEPALNQRQTAPRQDQPPRAVGRLRTAHPPGHRADRDVPRRPEREPIPRTLPRRRPPRNPQPAPTDQTGLRAALLRLVHPVPTTHVRPHRHRIHLLLLPTPREGHPRRPPEHDLGDRRRPTRRRRPVLQHLRPRPRPGTTRRTQLQHHRPTGSRRTTATDRRPAADTGRHHHPPPTPPTGHRGKRRPRRHRVRRDLRTPSPTRPRPRDQDRRTRPPRRNHARRPRQRRHPRRPTRDGNQTQPATHGPSPSPPGRLRRADPPRRPHQQSRVPSHRQPTRRPTPSPANPRHGKRPPHRHPPPHQHKRRCPRRRRRGQRPFAVL